MTSLKTKNIWFLAAFVFLSIVPTLAEVVATVQGCNHFLLQGTPPNIPKVLVNRNIQIQNRYKIICQTFNGMRRYLTVYDTVNKIPVFSAYEYTGSVRGRCEDGWMIEPQLDENPTEDNINMRKQGRNTYTNQAVNADYDGNNPLYDKGHLFPVRHAPNHSYQISTFTLTNVVPQHRNFNRGRWSQMEKDIRNIMNQHINNQIRCFVVVGAHPGNNYLNNNLNNRVNIPDWMWSAFYCTDQTSRAYWSDNDDVDPLHEGTLEDLRNRGIDPFPRAP